MRYVRQPLRLSSTELALYEPSTLVELVERVRALQYGRPSERTVASMLREGRGTCSTKHLFLAQVLQEQFPETEPQIIHRVYTLDRASAARIFGVAAADVVPPEGLTDVHRYLIVTINGGRITIDATFTGEPWDGRSPMKVACGAGHDYVAGSDPDAEKRELEAKFCDSLVRERFIAALTTT